MAEGCWHRAFGFPHTEKIVMMDYTELTKAAQENGSPALEAVKLVYGQRNLDYGDPFQNFKEIAEIANAIKDRNDTNIYTSYNVCTVLRALKLARIKYNPTADSFADLCGYTDIQGRMAAEKMHKPSIEPSRSENDSQT